MSRADERRKQEQALADLLAIAATGAGKRFLLRLIQGTGIYHATFHPTNPHASAFAEGRRDVGLMLLGWLNDADPSIYLHLVQTNAEQLTREREQRKRRNARRRNDNDGPQPEPE